MIDIALFFTFGIAIGILIRPAMRAYADYYFYRNSMRYSVKRSISQVIDDIRRLYAR